MTIQLLTGDARDVLPTLPADSVHCVVCSPPYYGLRDYGTALWDGGDAACDHLVQQPKRGNAGYTNGQGQSYASNLQSWGDRAVPAPYRDTCGKCGARRIDRQIGLEPTPEAYLATMVQVFREVKRVLRPDGTCWVNMGDSYCSTAPGTMGDGINQRGILAGVSDRRAAASRKFRPETPHGLKPKDLLLMPARLALALQAPQHYGPIAKETDRAWLAALIDGEGTISIARNVASKSRGGLEYCQPSYTPFISIGNQDRELLDKCVAITGLGKVNVKDRPSVDPRGINSRRTYYGWRIDARQAIGVLRDVFPYLVAKRKQAVLAHTLDVSNLSGRSLRGNGPLPASEQAKREQLKVLCNAANQRQPIDMPTWLIEPPSNFEQGWWIRSDIIWHKPNPMPESVTDRCVSAHEHVFMLTKSPRYYFDNEAIRERTSDNSHGSPNVNPGWKQAAVGNNQGGSLGKWTADDAANGRSCRNVWTLATQSFPDSHYATYPTALVERCIKAGTSERGCCAACGKPWGRVIERGAADLVHQRACGGDVNGEYHGASTKGHTAAGVQDASAVKARILAGMVERATTGWSPGCKCDAGVVPCTVLDPFLGSGTSALVADRLQRHAIGIDLSLTYATMAQRRIELDCPLFTSWAPAEDPEDERMRDLFAGDEYQQIAAPVPAVQRDAFRNSDRYVNQPRNPSNGMPEAAE